MPYLNNNVEWALPLAQNWEKAIKNKFVYLAKILSML
jgi:hypothetical protein